MSEKRENKNIILSIVTPTLGKFSHSWLEQLLNVHGDVEFILAYPPGISPLNISDPRVKIIESSYRSEYDQRVVGLLEASGEYVLALDDDDFVHPDVVELVVKYFNRFPESWALRLRQRRKTLNEKESFTPNWQEIPEINKLSVASLIFSKDGLYRLSAEDKQFVEKGKALCEVPIVPIKRPFDKRWLFWPFNKRTDQNGYHMENFNTKVWKKKIVHETLLDLLESSKLIGTYKIMPRGRCGFDRVLGLYLQAKFYDERKVIGHWMPLGREQIFKIYYRKRNPYNFSDRSHHFHSHLILVKRFPFSGYIWNLFIAIFWGIPRYFIKSILYKCRNLKTIRKSTTGNI